MPVITVNPIVPMSSVWTVRRVVNQIRMITGEPDSEKIQNSHIRNYINTAVAYLAEVLNEAEKPDYGVTWLCTQETTKHISGLDWIDLTHPLVVSANAAYERNFSQNKHTAAGEIIPFTFLDSIDYLSCKASTVVGEQDTIANVLQRNCRKFNLEEITTLSNGFNNQYRQDIGYCPYGRDILLFFGSEITAEAAVAPDNVSTFYERPYHFVLWGKRRPLMDNLLEESDSTSSFDEYVDVADEHIRLLIMLVQKSALEHVAKQIDNSTAQAIAQEIAQIRGFDAQEEQEDTAKRNMK